MSCGRERRRRVGARPADAVGRRTKATLPYLAAPASSMRWLGGMLGTGARPQLKTVLGGRARGRALTEGARRAQFDGCSPPPQPQLSVSTDVERFRACADEREIPGGSPTNGHETPRSDVPDLGTIRTSDPKHGIRDGK